ncbi:cupin domain-containing protein [Spirillospora sp. CA-253888]
MTDGSVVPPGRGELIGDQRVSVTFKVTGADSRHTSIFESRVAPGFDTGAHLHRRLEESFYVLEGELEVFAFEPTLRTADDWTGWQAHDGRRPVRAGPGTCVFVPPGCPHAFRNPSCAPARFLFTASPPPDHEHYLRGIAQILAARADVDEEAVARLRTTHDTHQITPLRYRP